MIGIHHLLKRQLPEFVREKYPTFCKFLDYYYRWLMAHGFSKLENISDIDLVCNAIKITYTDGSEISLETLKSFIGYEIKDTTNGARASILGVSDDGKVLVRYITKDAKFDSEDAAELVTFINGKRPQVLIEGSYNIPTIFIENFSYMLDANNIVDFNNENIALLLKHIKEYYTMKGTEESVNFLLYALKGVDSKVMYPWENVLKPSDGHWHQYYSIALKTTKEDIAKLSGNEKILKIMNYGVLEYKNFNIKSIEFFKNEKYEIEKIGDEPEYEQYIRIHLYEKPNTVYFGLGSICKIETENDYFTGEVVSDIVGIDIDKGSILNVNVEFGGINYTTSATSKVVDTSGKNASLYTSVVDGSISGIGIINRGENYSQNAQINIEDSSGTGAYATVSVSSGGSNWTVGEVFKLGGTDEWKTEDNSYDIRDLLPSGNGRWFERNGVSSGYYNLAGDVYKASRAEVPLLGRVTSIDVGGGLSSIEILQSGEYIKEGDPNYEICEISPLLYENRSSWDETYNANIKFRFGIVNTEVGYWDDERGFLSYPDIVLQDSTYFQQFSYDIFTENDNNENMELLKDIHPSGTKQFNTQLIVDSWDLSSNLQFDMAFPYVLIENCYTEVNFIDEYFEHKDDEGHVIKTTTEPKKHVFKDMTIDDYREVVVAEDDHPKKIMEKGRFTSSAYYRDIDDHLGIPGIIFLKTFVKVLKDASKVTDKIDYILPTKRIIDIIKFKDENEEGITRLSKFITKDWFRDQTNILNNDIAHKHSYKGFSDNLKLDKMDYGDTSDGVFLVYTVYKGYDSLTKKWVERKLKGLYNDSYIANAFAYYVVTNIIQDESTVYADNKTVYSIFDGIEYIIHAEDNKDRITIQKDGHTYDAKTNVSGKEYDVEGTKVE